MHEWVVHKVNQEAPIGEEGALNSLQAVSVAQSIICASWLPRKRDDEIELLHGSTAQVRPP